MKLVIFYLLFSYFLILNYFVQSFHSLVMATNINKIDENPNFKIEEHSSIDIQKNVTWPEMLQSMITEKECSSSSVRNNLVIFFFFFLPYFMDIFFIFIYFYLFSFISIYFHLFSSFSFISLFILFISLIYFFIYLLLFFYLFAYFFF